MVLEVPNFSSVSIQFNLYSYLNVAPGLKNSALPGREDASPQLAVTRATPPKWDARRAKLCPWILRSTISDSRSAGSFRCAPPPPGGGACRCRSRLPGCARLRAVVT